MIARMPHTPSTSAPQLITSSLSGRMNTAYAVFMRPLNELVINCGALVLGVWGIRAIIVPTSQNYLTSVELSLACVILFLLLAITVRALRFIHDRAGLHLLPASPPPAAS